jgi:hypothetical protein
MGNEKGASSIVLEVSYSHPSKTLLGIKESLEQEVNYAPIWTFGHSVC